MACQDAVDPMNGMAEVISHSSDANRIGNPVSKPLRNLRSNRPAIETVDWSFGSTRNMTAGLFIKPEY